MKNLTEFQKLFKVNFPIEEHHQYYIDTLKKSEEYDTLAQKILDFEELEKFSEEKGYKSSKAYKLDYALPKVKNYLLSTKAYESLLEEDFGSHKLRTKDELRNNDNTYLLSIDFKAANYNSLKKFDESGELCDTWEELCEKLDVHPTLAKSKSFRQYCFGNTNPKRLQRTQHTGIVKIVDSLINDGLLSEGDFVFISHDEFIIRLRPDHLLAVGRVMRVINAVEDIIERENINMPIHYKVFKNEAIGKGMCVQSIYNVKLGGLSESYKSLFKVPGNKYFKYFKKYIINEPIDKRDLMFVSDGDIAVWSKDEDSVVEVFAPEGEMTLEEVKGDYEYLFNRLKKEVPGLNDSQVRKMINIFISVCPVCHEEERPCNCLNDI